MKKNDDDAKLDLDQEKRREQVCALPSSTPPPNLLDPKHQPERSQKTLALYKKRTRKEAEKQSKTF